MQRELDCIFCRIVAGEAPCARVHEDDYTVAFMDIFPVSRGHTLVITKEHYPDIFEAPPGALSAVAAVARRVALAIRQELHPDGLGVFQLNGSAAGQTVFHYHMHLVPRAAGEAFVLHGRTRASAQELEHIAARLASALSAIP